MNLLGGDQKLSRGQNEGDDLAIKQVQAQPEERYVSAIVYVVTSWEGKDQE